MRAVDIKTFTLDPHILTWGVKTLIATRDGDVIRILRILTLSEGGVWLTRGRRSARAPAGARYAPTPPPLRPLRS